MVTNMVTTKTEVCALVNDGGGRRGRRRRSPAPVEYPLGSFQKWFMK